MNDVNPDDIGLVCKNNGKVKVKRSITNNSMRRILKEVFGVEGTDRAYHEKLNELSNALVPFMFEELGIEAREGYFPEDFDIKEYKEEEMADIDFDKNTELVQVVYKGKNYTVSEFREAAKELFNEKIDLFSSIAYPGKYLYRAVDAGEWRSIKEKRYWCLLDNTNFESDVGPQVKHYLRGSGYAGVIVRIPVKGPFFRSAGFQVPRITSFMSHFICEEDIYVSETGKKDSFITLKRYLHLKETQHGHSIETAL